MQFDRTIGGTRVVNAGSVGMPYEDEPGAYWLLDLEHRLTRVRRRSPASSGRGKRRCGIFTERGALTSSRSAASGNRTGSTAPSSSRARATATRRFARGATVWVDGETAEIVGSRRGSGGRPVIRLDRRVARGATLAVPRDSLPELEDDAYYHFQLVGLVVEEEDGGRVLGVVSDVVHYPANDVLELDSGLLLPLVEACVRQVDLDGRRILVSTGFAGPE